MKTLEEINELMATVGDATADTLATIKQDVLDLFDSIIDEPTTADQVAALNQLTSHIDKIMARSAEIDAEAQALEENKAAAKKLRDSLDGSGDEGDEGDKTPEGAEGAEDKDGAEKEPVLASGEKKTYRSSASRMNGRTPALRPITSTDQRAALVASGSVQGIPAGTPFTDEWALAEVMCDQLSMMDRRQSHGRVLIASANFKNLYPDERRLIKGDIVGNAKKMEAITGRKALLASGGTCLPLNVDYTLPTWGTADRPFKEGAAQFQSDRGGLLFRNPPTVASLAGATSIWTEATDADPGDNTKPVLAIACAEQVTVYVDAVPTRLQFGNMMGQFDPDTVSANTQTAIVAAARIAEVNLLNKLQAACTLNITSAQVLGASRDWFTTIDRVVANYRYTNRLNPTQVITIVLPDFVKGMIRSDRVMELAHDGQSIDPFAITDQWIEDTLMTRYVKAIWTLDGIAVNGEVYPAQGFTGFTTAEPVPAWPTAIVWNAYVEGSIQFLDSGLLNLGVVRDATLDATNDYETFIETFEGLAYRGFGGGALQIVSTLVPNGESSEGVAVS